MGHSRSSSSQPSVSSSFGVGGGLVSKRQRRVLGGRSSRWNVRASESDAEVIVAKAERAGVSVPRFLVSLAVSGEVRSSVERKGTVAALMGLRRQLAGVGTNLNQLAHYANSMGELSQVDRLDEALVSVEVLCAQLETVLVEVERS